MKYEVAYLVDWDDYKDADKAQAGKGVDVWFMDEFQPSTQDFPGMTVDDVIEKMEDDGWERYTDREDASIGLDEPHIWFRKLVQG